MADTFTATAQQGETLDELCWRELGMTGGVVEQALQLNPGLAGQGPFLTEGQTIVLPFATAQRVPTRAMVQLWD